MTKSEKDILANEHIRLCVELSLRRIYSSKDIRSQTNYEIEITKCNVFDNEESNKYVKNAIKHKILDAVRGHYGKK